MDINKNKIIVYHTHVTEEQQPPARQAEKTNSASNFISTRYYDVVERQRLQPAAAGCGVSLRQEVSGRDVS